MKTGLAMKFELQTTPAYERDLRKLTSAQQLKLTKRLAHLIHLFQTNRKAFFTHAYRPVRPRLEGNLTSTVWILRVSAVTRVMFAYDEDPLFETLQLILLRIFNHDELRNGEFLKTAADFHHSHGLELIK
jgi:hypothetical protein